MPGYILKLNDEYTETKEFVNLRKWSFLLISDKSRLRNFIKSFLIKIHLLEIAKEIKRYLKYKISYFKYGIFSALFKNNFEKQASRLLKIIGCRIVFINPKIINSSLKGISAPTPRENFIFKGDWDINKEFIWSETLQGGNIKSMGVRMIKELFVDRVPYKKCQQYRIMKNNLKKGIFYRNYTSLKQIDNYFEGLIKIFEDIRDNGYKTQELLKTECSDLSVNENDEIYIFTDRNGDIIGGNSGRHRLAITKVLNLKKIPVLLVGVHYNWAKKCFEKYNTDVLTAINKGLNELNL